MRDREEISLPPNLPSLLKKNLECNKRDGNYGGSLAIVSLSITNEVREIAGETKVISTAYEKCKMMLIPITLV